MAEKKKKKEDSEAVSAPEPAAVKLPTPPKNIKIPKLAKSGKARLPRKLKKAQQTAARQAASRQ